jgi:hypothetical protein
VAPGVGRKDGGHDKDQPEIMRSKIKASQEEMKATLRASLEKVEQ